MDNSELATQVISLNKELELLNEQRIRALGKQESARNQMESLKAQIESLGSSPETLEADIAAAKSQLEEPLTSKRAEMSALESNLKKIEELEK